MVTKLNPLPPIPTPVFSAWLGEQSDPHQAVLGQAATALGPLLELAPYLLGLAQDNVDWLVAAL
ncbi:MAG TPA: hypothetical protein VKY62_06830, partial [Devosia sp.]|nr:hypothetical protein [Devosia sp.]